MCVCVSVFVVVCACMCISVCVCVRGLHESMSRLVHDLQSSHPLTAAAAAAATSSSSLISDTLRTINHQLSQLQPISRQAQPISHQTQPISTPQRSVTISLSSLWPVLSLGQVTICHWVRLRSVTGSGRDLSLGQAVIYH